MYNLCEQTVITCDCIIRYNYDINHNPVNCLIMTS